MIQLILASDSLDLGDDLQKIYFDSFPADERREWQEIRQLLSHPCYYIYQITVDEKLTGLISIWRWPEFIFIEHFALSIPMRRLGIGTQVMKQLMSENPPLIIVEVELPEAEAAMRRIAFYERLGFSLSQEDYYQPPYSPNKNNVQMLLMSYPHTLSPKEFLSFKARVYKQVYRIE